MYWRELVDWAVIALVWGFVIFVFMWSMSGCGEAQFGFIPNTRFEQRQQQELRDFIAARVTASSQNVQNEIKPWIWGMIAAYTITKIFTTLGFWLQNRRLVSKIINGGTRRRSSE